MYNPIYFHEFTFTNCHGDKVIDLLIGTEDATNRLMSHYKDSDHKLVTLWHITDIDQVQIIKYKRVRIIR